MSTKVHAKAIAVSFFLSALSVGAYVTEGALHGAAALAGSLLVVLLGPAKWLLS